MVHSTILLIILTKSCVWATGVHPRSAHRDNVCFKRCYKRVSYSTVSSYESCGFLWLSRCSRYSYRYKMEKSRCSHLCSPVDGQWSNYTSWSTWSKCDKTCGSGTKRRTRTRSCTDPTPKHGGKHCSGSSSDTESKSCYVKECPIDGEWSVYRPPSTWSSCSKTCNTGIRTRTRFRTCTNPAPKFGGKHCLGSSIRLESRSCKLRECPIDGKWADYRPWSSWSGCDKTCGNGFRTRTRTRTCTDPTPKYGGKLCPGSTDNRGLDSCKIRECPIDGKWADYRPWSAWSSCDKTCGNGFRTKTRTRTCTNPTPKYGGKLCPGSTIDKGFVSCKVRECPIDGNWTPYIVTVNWTSCSTSCGAGTATRILFRSCSNPKPRYGGKNCVGNYRKKETKICEDRECPLQGEWTDYKLWSTWSNCDKTCGTGNKARIQTRKCTDPVPKNGGQQCQGPASRRETSSCKVRECPVDGNWTPYFVSVNWTCSVSCGEGTATRTLSRRCSNPKPQYGGKLCVGNEVKTETKICKDRQCPDKGEWSSVTSGGEWSECSQTCNKGTQTRTRTCKNSVSGNQGRSCLGESEKIETKACMIVKCPDVQEIENAAQKDTMSAITIAYIITVPGIIIICIGVNVVTYRYGVKKGRRIERKHNLHGFQEETQAVHYQHYHNDDENPEARPLAQQAPSAGQVSVDPTHDYAAYDEIKDQRQRMQESQRRKEGGYLTPVSQDQSRALPPVRTNGDGYISPKAAAKKSLEESRKTSKSDSPSPPGNGGYISPLQQEKDSSEKMGSGNSDSSSEKSDKSDKSRKYQNEPSSKSSPKTKALYESLKDTGVTQEHQYIELQT